jgi:hypothetical protein
MRGALIHGVLLVVMLVYGYRTWTRDTTVQPDHGSVVLWDKRETDLVSLELKSDTKIVRLERRGQGNESYWWGSETTIEKKPKPPAPKPPEPPADAGSGSAGSGSAAGSASAATPPPAADDQTRKTREFPTGEAAEELLQAYAKARALRDLGQPTEEQTKDYKLGDAKTTVTVTFKDGARTFLLGGSVYGGSDRYALDQQSKHAYVLSKDLISNFEMGDAGLHLVDPRGFNLTKLETVTIEAAGKSKTVGRVQAPGSEGQQIRTWGDPETKKADQTIANFIDNVNNLRPAEYRPDLKIADLTLVLKLTYKDARGKHLGDFMLYKHDKQGELAPKTDLDPANPPPSETEYLIVTDKTRVPGIVRKDSAGRAEQDIATVFSDHPTSIEPKTNPFGNTPLPPREPPAKPPGAPAPGTAPPAPGAPGAAPTLGAPGGDTKGASPGKADAPKAPGAPPAKADAPKPPGAAPAKTDAPKPPGGAPAKTDAPKPPAGTPPKG